MNWKISNFVISGKLKNFVFSNSDFELLQNSLIVLEIDSFYNYESFYGLTLYFPSTKATAVIFPNGHMNLTGCNSLRLVNQSLHQLLETLKACFILLSVDNSKYKLTTTFEKLEISNICASIKLPFKINIEKIVQDKLLDYVYVFDENNNKIFYYPYKPINTCFIIFKSGSVNVVGGQNLSKINQTLNFLSLFLKMYEITIKVH